jgi:hypothetical protein
MIMPSETPMSTLIEALFLGGLLVFAACMFVWYRKECQKIERDFEPLDRTLAELKAKNDEWFNRNSPRRDV